MRNEIESPLAPENLSVAKDERHVHLAGRCRTEGVAATASKASPVMGMRIMSEGPLV